MASPARFVPKDDNPEWKRIYDALLETAEFGDIITYAQLDVLLARRFKANRAPIYRANKHLGEMRKRWLAPVNGVGYRVIEAREHMDIAQNHKRRARRQLKTMVRVAQCTELSKLSQDELTRFDSQARINEALFFVAIHHEKRLQKIEAVLRDHGHL